MDNHPFLARLDESKEFYTDERCHILEMLHNQSEGTFSIARARVEPGVVTAWHRLKDTEEYYYILSGEGIMEINEEPEMNVRAGDIVTIPSGASQRITNPDLEKDLLFLAICSPPFHDKAYEGLE